MIASIPADRLHFNISLDGNQHSNDEIRGLGMYDKAIRGYQNIRLADDQAGNSRRKILTNTILHAGNLQHFEDILQQQAELGFDGVQILNLFRSESETSTEEDALWFRESQWPALESLCTRLIQRKMSSGHTGYRIQNTIEELSKIPAYYQYALKPLDAPCWAGWKELYINADGKAIMCDGQLDFLNGSFGSIRQQSLRELWRSADLEERRKVVKSCQTPCVQTCYLRQQSDSGRELARDAVQLLSQQLQGHLHRFRRSWTYQPEDMLRLELSDVCHSDYEARSTPANRWKELIKDCPEPPSAENWWRFRDEGRLNFGRGFMGFEVVRRIVDNLANQRLHFGTVAIAWRGEPLLHPEIEPILNLLMDWVSKGMFDRIRIETSGRFLQSSIASLAGKSVPQEWILDIDHGDGAGLKLLQSHRGEGCRIVLRQRVINGLHFQATRPRFPQWPVFVGSYPEVGDALWFSRVDAYGFASDQQSDREVERLAQEAGVAIATVDSGAREQRCAVVSWDGKVTLCNRDVRLQQVIGEVNHNHFHELWSSVSIHRPVSSLEPAARDFCTACGQVHTPDLY